MADIVNLRTARKRKKRAENELQAQHNRIKYGRTKHEKTLSKKQGTIEKIKLDGHKLTE